MIALMYISVCALHFSAYSTGTTNGFQTYGISSNLDYEINDKIKFRIEGKMFHSKDKIFVNESNNYSLTTNMTIKL